MLIFAPELLAGAHYYARLFSGRRWQLAEESDRYAQALLYKDIACACFAAAQQLHSDSSGVPRFALSPVLYRTCNFRLQARGRLSDFPERGHFLQRLILGFGQKAPGEQCL